MNEPPLTRPEIDWSRAMMIVVGLWLVLVTLVTAIFVLAGSLGLTDAFLFSVRLWLAWLVCGPFAVWMGFRFSLHRPHLASKWAIHLIACIIVIGTNQFVARVFSIVTPVARGEPPSWVAAPKGKGQIVSRQPSSGPPAMARLVIDGFVYAILVSICQTLLWSHYARDRQKRALQAEAEVAKATLRSLQMQINPHFLFNALNAISTLVHTDPNTADDMLGNLGDLLRASLDSAGEQEVSLNRELSFLQCYLELERARFGERLVIEKSVDPEVLDARVPTFILQPLVENAVRHGVEPKQTGGTITLTASSDGCWLLLGVRDTGVGLDENSSVTGIGLANTRARLEQLYNDNEYELMINNSADGGCIVRLKLPLRRGSGSENQTV